MDIQLKIIDRQGEFHEYEIPSDCGLNLMELCKSAELGVEGICGGMALCGSCMIYIDQGPELPGVGEDEEKMLDTLMHVRKNSRLACQIKISEKINGLQFTIAPNQ
ncbi:MAG: 2Fe-2S iron-sulfur cluster binding domain-containing protein [Saprospiraceae bacterium]|nr:2Fe-2S iron-sulfur cluster binding domain-containing protein [Saprospiraceae bacterium]HMW39271.1 2Fe-2S iron-sulfur cluster-binding protein [Saprospiraceae bacterium]HMX89095.1 2Fe-2S iron-sulfur cluster-binding protein [Saprospiraceae bacterium]HMZ40966.1 2Fe-2S iron-sulfur cluster-binding protein [Saprospiraceae bacterium]HNA65103.1 2Fe-2S iron-sulfur cluster-binding protein [Saprospiraceae bacterium]